MFKTDHVIPYCVCAVVDQEVVVAVQLKLIEAEHEFLQDRFCLERDGTIQVWLILRSQNRPVDLAVQLLQEMSLAQGCHVICPSDIKKHT